MLLALLWAGVVADLSPETVPRLKLAWNYNTNATPPSKRAAQIAAFEATPVLSDGLLYVLTPFNQVIALDPETGSERWRYDPRLAADRGYSEATARGVAASGGVLYFGTLDTR